MPYHSLVTEASDPGIWDDVVAGPWIRCSGIVDAHSEVFGAAAMERLAPLVDARVVDVGCGLGSTTRRLGELVGPRGAVVGVDNSEPFVAEARRRGGAPTVTYLCGDAAQVDLPPVDAVYSRFGVMFFPDPVAAFAHLRSLTSTGGRLAFTCWQEPSRNPWMLEPIVAAMPVLGPPQLPAPGSPGPFSLADPEVIRSTLERAGWSGIDIDSVAVEQPYPAGGAEATAEVVVQLAPPLATALRAAPEQRDAAVAAIADALRARERDGAVHFEAAAWVVSAARR